MVIVDASVWIHYLRSERSPETRWLHDAADEEAIGLADLTLCEVLQGIQREPVYKSTLEFLGRFAIIPAGGREQAERAAGVYRRLRGLGFTVRGTVDCFLIALCLTSNHVLLHRDRDFDPAEEHLGLRVLHP